MNTILLFAVLVAPSWAHPAGMVTPGTIAEAKEKVANHTWAKETHDAKRAEVEKWLAVSSEKLREVFPKARGNVYHNFSCPDDRTRLIFDPFESSSFRCGTCGKTFPPETDAGIYPEGDFYHGTMYDGWACIFYQTSASIASDLATLALMDGDERCAQRAIELLGLFATTIKGLPTCTADRKEQSRILTYHREGDNKILYDLAIAFESARDKMPAEERDRVRSDVLERMLNDLMLEPIYTYDHNNVYQWHRTIVQTALALERADLVDWSLGVGEFSPEKLPEHRSIRRILEKNFKPDGAYWELCSGYHLYPVFHLCELAALTHNLSVANPDQFPASTYDLTDPSNPGYQTVKNALEWFMSMAMPDRTVTVIGDSTVPRAGMNDYFATAEVGYRYYGVKSIGDYESVRRKRTWFGLLVGADEIVQEPTPFTSSYLSSGWVSLRNGWAGNRVWVGLNALQPGGGHQHADRLNLTLYSQGELLALEKATPYNESVTRELGTLTQSHNTVVVDKKSQKQGEALVGDEVPQVAIFVSGAVLKYAEVRGDGIYPGLKRYRRSVALIEDVVLDVFEVEGGTTHDWMVNHAGGAPEFSFGTEPMVFEPSDWLYHGTDRARGATVGGDWSAKWRVGEVTSRLTMLESPSTQVFGLETYPIDNAIVTEGHPACQTLCVRRTDNAPFIALWDSWKGEANLVSVERKGQGILLKTRGNAYYILLGPGKAEFVDGLILEGDGQFSILRGREAMAFAGGTQFSAVCPEGHMSVRLNQAGNAEVDWSKGHIEGDKVQSIQYDTYGGEDHRRPSGELAVTLDGNLPVASLVGAAGPAAAPEGQ